jgi:hypothetical protein
MQVLGWFYHGVEATHATGWFQVRLYPGVKGPDHILAAVLLWVLFSEFRS